MAYKLLIIEDDEGLATLYQQIFTMNGFDTDVAITVPEAVDYLNQNRYAVCIADVYVGIHNALETIVQHNAYLSHTAEFIIHSGDGRYAKHADSLHMTYCGKPIEIEPFVNIVTSLAEKRATPKSA